MNVDERLDKIEAVLNQLLTAFHVSPKTHNPSASSSVGGECLEEHDGKCTPMDSLDFQPQFFRATLAETPAAVRDKLGQKLTELSNVPVHPWEKTFWEAVERTACQSSRKELLMMVQEVLQGIVQRSDEVRQMLYRN